MTETGWFKDPFDEHEARWFSAGRPTDLVRDESTESRHEPLQPDYSGPLEPFTQPPSGHGEDLVRSDDEANGAGTFDSGSTASAAAWAGDYGPTPLKRS